MTCSRILAWLPVAAVPLIPLTIATGAVEGIGLIPAAAAWLYSLHYTFRDTLNLVQGLGPFYYIVRDTERSGWGLRRALMRETDYPWRRGQGLEVEVPRRTLQVGLCRRRPVHNEEDGLLDVLDGRIMDTSVEEIRGW